MIILCCFFAMLWFAMCFSLLSVFCHFATTLSFGAFFPALWPSCSLCVTRPGGKVRLNEAENQSKRGLFSPAFSGRVAVNNSGGGSCAGVFFFRWLGWLIFLTCINTCLQVMHDGFVSPGYQVECTEHADRQEAANGSNLDFLEMWNFIEDYCWMF